MGAVTTDPPPPSFFSLAAIARARRKPWARLDLLEVPTRITNKGEHSGIHKSI